MIERADRKYNIKTDRSSRNDLKVCWITREVRKAEEEGKSQIWAMKSALLLLLSYPNLPIDDKKTN